MRIRNAFALCVAAAAALLLFGCEEPGPSRTGSIRVTSTPSGARIFLDQSDTGRVTPYAIPEVSAGFHTIRLTLAGHADWGPQSVSVAAGQTATVTATLEAAEPTEPPEPVIPPERGLGLELLDVQAYQNAHILRADPVALPASVDLSLDVPVPGNQGGQGSCVGWAVAFALKSYHERIERGWPLTADRHVMSPAYVYNQIKVPGGGAYFLDAFNLLIGQGVSSWAQMPYDPRDDRTQPSAAARAEAANYRIAEWGVVLRTTHAIFVQEIKRHLATGVPVVIGVPVYPDFDSLSESNPVYDHTGGHRRGYHAIVIVGYDDALSAFRIINSWGADWGIDGYGWIDYAASKSLIRSAYVTRDVVASPDDERPVAASGPSPGNAVNGVAVGTVLSWTRNARTTSFDVYLGTDRDLAAADFQGNVAQATFSPDLAPGSRYYWRIDARGAGGVTPGPVWSFTTAGRLQLPGKAIGPSPAHGATAVARNTVLRWDSGGHTTSYDVYFGTNPRPGASGFQGTQAMRTFSPGALSAGTRYYWRIDAKNGQGTTTGDVWSFTTAGVRELPGRAVSPSPTDGATGVGLHTTLNWDSGGHTTSFDVYFGRSPTLGESELQRTQAGRTFTPGRLLAGTRYYWRVDAKNGRGTTPGDVWSFTTVGGSQPGLSVADASITEGNSGRRTMSFRVTLSAPSTQQVRVSIGTVDGTATANSGDYDGSGDWVTFSPGETSKRFPVVVRGDTEVEDDETFTVEVRSVENATVVDGIGVGTIINDDTHSPPRPGKAVNPSPGDGATGMARDVMLRWDSGGHTTSYDVYFGRNRALGASELQRTQAARTFDPGRLSAGTRYYWRVDAKNGQGTTTGDVWSFSTESVAELPGLSIADASRQEGPTNLKRYYYFRVALSSTTARQVRVSYATMDGTATAGPDPEERRVPGADYGATSGELTFSPGDVSKAIRVATFGDENVEQDEYFYVILSNPVNATLVDHSATGTIVNDDIVTPTQPSLSISNVSKSEGDRGSDYMRFPVRLSAPSTQTVAVTIKTYDGSATGGSDYRAERYRIAISPGELEATPGVLVYGDTEVEEDETFTVEMESAENATIVDGIALGTIINDDVRSPRISWRSVASGTSEDLYGVAWNGRRFVVVGNETILYSTDGVTWSRVSSVDSWNRQDTHRWRLFDIASNATRLVAVGGFGIARSPDGITWTRDWTDSAFGPYVNLYGVVWSGTRFVAVGSRTIANSLDGITWPAAAAGVPSNFLSGVAWNGTRFVAVGFRGSILHSTDGNTWMAASSGTSWNLRGVAWNGTRTVAVGMVGTIVHTADGIVWRGAADSGTSASLNDVAWNGSRFVAVGEGGTIVHSSDGSSWSAATGGTSRDLRGIAWSGARFVAVGHGGTILVSP